LDKKAWSPNLLHEVLRSKLPLARKFPGKRKFWALAGKMPGNPFWKEIDRKLTGNTMNYQDKGRKF
jgi:hypothetical protein